jgi:hypothetical protein
MMKAQTPKYTKEEHARLGNELYERRIRPLVEAGNRAKIVAIDVDSGEFELDSDTLVATNRLLERVPDAQVWMLRIGYPGVHRFGYRVKP